MQYCPHCQNSLPPDLVACFHCGIPLDSSQSIPELSAGPYPQDPNLDAPISQAPIPQLNSPKSISGKKVGIIAAAAIILLLGLAVGGHFMGFYTLPLLPERAGEETHISGTDGDRAQQDSVDEQEQEQERGSDSDSTVPGGTPPASGGNTEPSDDTAPGNIGAKAGINEIYEIISARIEQVGIDAQLWLDEEEQLFRVLLPDSAFFDTVSASIKQEAYQTLDTVIEMLLEIEPLYSGLYVEAHSDSRPINTAQYPSNRDLTTSRASNILDFLIDDGRLDAGRMYAIGYGEERPIAPNDTPENMALNRRVEFVVVIGDYYLPSESPSAQDVEPSELPTEPETTLGRIVAVSAGDTHTMALDDKGQLWAWGDNYYGQVGNGRISTYHDPIFDESDDMFIEPIDGRRRDIDNDAYVPQYIMRGIRAIYARGNSSFAITVDGELYSWGRNHVGQLADGTRRNRSSPGYVMSGVLDVDSHWGRTIILKTDHTLWVSGQAFDYDADIYQEPTLFYSNVKKAVLEGSTSYGGVLILTNDDMLIAFSRPLVNAPHEFMEITGLRNIIDISAASQQVYVLTSGGDVYGWGAHAGSDLGVDVSDFWVYQPTLIASNIEKILRGRMFISRDGALLVWSEIPDLIEFRNSHGEDAGGALLGTLVEYGVLPTEIMTGVHSADGIRGHLAAIDINGNVYTWGNNFYGQLGDGSSISRLVPTQITFPEM